VGCQLDWRELPEKKASRILIRKDVNFDNKDQWPEQFDWIIDKTLKFKQAYKQNA